MAGYRIRPDNRTGWNIFFINHATLIFNNRTQFRSVIKILRLSGVRLLAFDCTQHSFTNYCMLTFTLAFYKKTNIFTSLPNVKFCLWNRFPLRRLIIFHNFVNRWCVFPRANILRKIMMQKFSRLLFMPMKLWGMRLAITMFDQSPLGMFVS
jgi:hypothetical protein